MKIKLENWIGRKYLIPTLIALAISVFLTLIPTGFEGSTNYQGSYSTIAKVLTVDNTGVTSAGLISFGEQTCQLKILKGKHKGEVASGINLLMGSLEQDKLFEVGETAFVRINEDDATPKSQITSISMIDHYRSGKLIILLGSFFLFVILFAGATGFRAVISFVLTILMVWKVIIPFYLFGRDPILIAALAISLLTLMIIALVFGFDRRCLAAVTGSITGIILTTLLAIWVTAETQIHGAVLPYSESLLYSGFDNLNLTKIFMATIFIGSSGAMMDLAVDITASISELLEKRPDLPMKETIFSGMKLGRAAMGTMTTTLLLAYSGGFIGLLMVFMAQGTPIENIVNFKYVAAELVHTIVGSFGLVLVAPLTAITSALFLVPKAHKQKD